MATVITITARGADGKVITKEVTVRGEVTTDDLVIKTRTVNAPTTKNPFHPDAISIADLKAGVRVRMHYLGGEPHVKSFSALIAEKPFENEDGNIVVAYYRVWDTKPFVHGYKEQLARNLGLCPYSWRCPSTWLLDWYVTAE